MHTLFSRWTAAACMAALLVVGGPAEDGYWSLSASGCERPTRTQASSSDENTAVRYVDPAQIKDLRIEWGSASATVNVADDEKIDGKIVISETAPNGWHDVPHMEIETEGEKLTVWYGTQVPSIALRSCSTSSEKRLMVTLPKSCAEKLDEVTFNGSALDATLSGVTCQSLQVDLSSGVFTAKKVATSDLDVDVSSGSVDFDGKVSESMDVDVSSGSARVRTNTAPKKANIDVSSGSIDLLLPRGTGFTANVDVGSGSFDCDFRTVERDGVLVAGDGAMALDVNVGSGEAHVGKR